VKARQQLQQPQKFLNQLQQPQKLQVLARQFLQPACHKDGQWNSGHIMVNNI
jgi:hypothetical protein